MENDYSKEVCEEDRLPMFHRTVKLPNGLWGKVKERGNQEKKALRWIVDDALDAELLPLVDLLRQLGLKGEVIPRRYPLYRSPVYPVGISWIYLELILGWSFGNSPRKAFLFYPLSPPLLRYPLDFLVKKERQGRAFLGKRECISNFLIPHLRDKANI